MVVRLFFLVMYLSVLKVVVCGLIMIFLLILLFLKVVWICAFSCCCCGTHGLPRVFKHGLFEVSKRIEIVKVVSIVWLGVIHSILLLFIAIRSVVVVVVISVMGLIVVNIRVWMSRLIALIVVHIRVSMIVLVVATPSSSSTSSRIAWCVRLVEWSCVVLIITGVGVLRFS